MTIEEKIQAIREERSTHDTSACIRTMHDLQARQKPDMQSSEREIVDIAMRTHRDWHPVTSSLPLRPHLLPGPAIVPSSFSRLLESQREETDILVRALSFVTLFNVANLLHPRRWLG